MSNPNLFDTWERGSLVTGTPEEERVTLLQGDSGSFDYSEWAGKIDLVFVDASHFYNAVVADTRAAVDMLAENGIIVWDDYPFYTGVWRCVNEFAQTVRDPVFHVRGTRLAVYRRGGLKLVHRPELAQLT